MSHIEFFNKNIKPNIQNILIDTTENINLKCGSINLDHGTINLDNGDIILMKGGLFLHSDKRLKTDIRPIENALDRIDKLKGVYYYWKGDDVHEKQEIGVIAQDVQQQFPELVNTCKNGVMSVDYAKLTAILIECVKDLKQQISGSK